MTTVFTQNASHVEQKQQSFTNLQRARELATRASDYSTDDTREALTTACLERCGNQPPYSWQLDAAEAFYLGLDCTIIAGTGFGKSLPFVMPSMICPDKILVVISPLNSLEEDQARRCHNMGLAAVAVNHGTYTSQVHQELEERQYQIIFTSPEMAIANAQFNGLLCSPAYQKHLLGVVIDEAHCIVQWGGDFRPAYAKLSKLRSFIPMDVPLYVTSATMTPSVLAEIRRSLHIDPSRGFHLNLGNNRKNIYQEVRLIRNSHDFASLDFLFTGITEAKQIERALIFVNQVIDTQLGWQHSRKLLPENLRGCVGFLHSRRSEASKREELDLFRTGERRVLWVTEIGGMGLDIPDITFAGQFGAPPSLTVWMQRAGRAGRAAGIQAKAVLFLEASALMQIRSRGDDDDESDHEDENEARTYRKKLEPNLREYVETPECRRDVVDKLFDNPPGRLALNSMCCDNCTERERSPPQSDTQPQLEDTNEPVTVKLESTQDTMPLARRVQPHLQNVRDALFSWRRRIVIRDFPHACFTSAVVLPDPILTTIASKRSISTLDDLHTSLSTPWAFADEYGDDVLTLVKKLDKDELIRQEAKRTADQEARRLESERKAVEKAANAEKARRGRQLQTAKENCVIPGTGCFDLREPKTLHSVPATPSFDSELPSSHPLIISSTPRPSLSLPMPRTPLSPRKAATTPSAELSTSHGNVSFHVYTPQHPPPHPPTPTRKRSQRGQRGSADNRENKRNKISD